MAECDGRKTLSPDTNGAVEVEAAARRFLSLVVPGQRFVLTTHVHPDGDGIGSEIALTVLLRRMGASVRIINHDPAPPMAQFLDPDGLLETYDPERHDPILAEADVIVMLDNSDPQRLERMFPVVRAATGIKVCIDHHPDPDPFWNLIMARLNSPCTGVIVHELFELAGEPLDLPAATALYTALLSDTGRFRFANTNAEGFRMAAKLVEAGVSPAAVYAQVSETLSVNSLRLYGVLLAGMEVRASGRLILLRVSADLLAHHNGGAEDLAEVINQALKMQTSRMAVLFRELGPQETKVSLRSKGNLDVNRLARSHGGGGHFNASGIVFPRPMEEVIQRLLPELEALVAEV